MNWQLNNSYLQLPEYFFTRVNPMPVKAPRLVLVNGSLIKALGLPLDELDDTELANFFSGNRLPDDAQPIAQAYAGHQFGHFTLLGDGRAHLIGECTSPDNKVFDIQLKGSGVTPYSRRGDGRAALGPMLREYVISEAMSALGIPTTRSLAVVTTGEKVLREQELNGAILTRVAASHIRVGTFQFVAANGSKDDLKQLADYTINRHYPELHHKDQPYIELVKVVMHRQINLVVNWLRVGFIHGVMNTDNMAISGETIDYGPCAFMDAYDPMTVFSSIDDSGRYAYGNQPAITIWNLSRFAECLLPLVDDNIEVALSKMDDVLQGFDKAFAECWFMMMRNKLGLAQALPEDEQLISALLELMQRYAMDYTLTFRALSSKNMPDSEPFTQSEVITWWQKWQARLTKENKSLDAAFGMMKANNPIIIPRNHQVEAALTAAEEDCDFSKVQTLLEAIAEPYIDKFEFVAFHAAPHPDERVYQTFCGT